MSCLIALSRKDMHLQVARDRCTSTIGICWEPGSWSLWTLHLARFCALRSIYCGNEAAGAEEEEEEEEKEEEVGYRAME